MPQGKNGTEELEELTIYVKKIKKSSKLGEQFDHERQQLTVIQKLLLLADQENSSVIIQLLQQIEEKSDAVTFTDLLRRSLLYKSKLIFEFDEFTKVDAAVLKCFIDLLDKTGVLFSSFGIEFESQKGYEVFKAVKDKLPDKAVKQYLKDKQVAREQIFADSAVSLLEKLLVKASQKPGFSGSLSRKALSNISYPGEELTNLPEPGDDRLKKFIPSDISNHLKPFVLVNLLLLKVLADADVDQIKKLFKDEHFPISGSFQELCKASFESIVSQLLKVINGTGNNTVFYEDIKLANSLDAVVSYLEDKTSIIVALPFNYSICKRGELITALQTRYVKETLLIKVAADTDKIISFLQVKGEKTVAIFEDMSVSLIALMDNELAKLINGKFINEIKSLISTIKKAMTKVSNGRYAAVNLQEMLDKFRMMVQALTVYVCHEEPSIPYIAKGRTFELIEDSISKTPLIKPFDESYLFDLHIRFLKKILSSKFDGQDFNLAMDVECIKITLKNEQVANAIKAGLEEVFKTSSYGSVVTKSEDSEEISLSVKLTTLAKSYWDSGRGDQFVNIDSNLEKVMQTFANKVTEILDRDSQPQYFQVAVLDKEPKDWCWNK